MAKQIKASEIFENEDIFRGVRESASDTIAVLEKMETQVKNTATELKNSIGKNKMDSSKNIKDFADAQTRANKLMMESIKIEELKQKALKATEIVETQRKKTMQETEKIKQQSQKTDQESLKTEQQSEKTDQQRIKTERERLRLERELQRENERKQKSIERAAKLARDEQSAYKQLEKQTRELKNASKELAAQLIQLENDGKKNTSQFREMSKQYTATTRAAQQADQQLKQIDSRVGDNFRNVGNYTGAISKLSNGLGMLGVSFGIGSVVSTGVQKIVEFDQSIADLSAITGATGKDLEYFKKQANELGLNVKGGASAVVEAYKLIGSAKPELLSNASALNQVTQSAITLANAAGMEVPEAATALTDAMNQFGAGADEADKFINVLAAGSKFGAVEIPQVTEALLQFGAVAKNSGVSIEESGALIEALGEKGKKGAEAGTALRNVMLKLSAPDALPKEAVDRLTALGINFDVLKDKSIPFTDRLRELKPLLNDNAAMVKTFGLENAVAATNLIQLTDRTDQLRSQMTGTNTAYEQANVRTNTLGHALMELKNSFFALFTTMQSGEGSGQWLIDSIKWLAHNLPTIIQYLFKLVRAWVTYQIALKAVQAYQWAASGGFRELGRSILENINFTKKAAQANQTLGQTATEAGSASKRAGAMIASIGWMLIINALIEVATQWYNVASGTAEARRQADLYAAAQKKAEEKSSATIEKEKARVDEQLRQLDLEIRKRKSAGENAAKLEEEKAKRTKEIYQQSKNNYQNNLKNQKNELNDINTLQKRYEKAVKTWEEWKGKRDGMWDWSETKQDAAKKELQTVQALITAKTGFTYTDIGVDTNPIAIEQNRRALEKAQKTQQMLIGNLDKGQKDFNDALEESEVQYMETTSTANDYNIAVTDHSGKIKNNLKDQQNFQTELQNVNDYLERTIALMQQLNEIGQNRELLKMDNEIEGAIKNAVKLVKETGSINVGVEANTETGEFGSMYDPIEQMIIDRYEKEKQFIQQKTQFAIDELQRQFDSETALEKQKLIDDRDQLLQQEGLTTAAKTKINESYNKRLMELDVEQKQRATDLELDKKLLREKGADDQKKLLVAQDKEINDYNDKILDGEKQFHDERTKKWKDDIAEITEKEKLLWSTINEYVKATTDFFVDQSQKRIDQISKEIAAAEKQFETYKQLAASGNILASQSLAEQQRIIAEKQREKEKLERRQQRLKLVESVFSTYNAKIQSGSKNAIAETFRDTTLLTQFIKTLPMFESGIEDTGKHGRGVDGRGGFHAVLHPNERVIPKRLNDQIGGLTNEQLTKLAIEYQNGKTFGSGATAIDSPLNFMVLVDKIDQLNETIRNKPETNIGIGEITRSAMEIVERKKNGNTITYNRFKIK
jgi:TP901 family phage tail tape measure protein